MFFKCLLKLKTPLKATVIISLYISVTTFYWSVRPLPQGLFVIPLYLASISFPLRYGWPILPITILIAISKPIIMNMQPLPMILQNYMIVTIVFTLLYFLGIQVKKTYDELNQAKEELDLLYNKEKELANIDFLTELGNYRFFQQSLSREFEHAQVGNYPLGLMLIDIDNFKGFNDTYGHQVGDLILEKIATIIKENIRREDIPCRYGGEEFVIIVPKANLMEVRKIGESIRKIIANNVFITFNQVAKVTISGGCSSYPEEADSPAQLIKKADEKLYQIKNTGKNNVA